MISTLTKLLNESFQGARRVSWRNLRNMLVGLLSAGRGARQRLQIVLDLLNNYSRDEFWINFWAAGGQICPNLVAGAP